MALDKLSSPTPGVQPGLSPTRDTALPSSASPLAPALAALQPQAAASLHAPLQPQGPQAQTLTQANRTTAAQALGMQAVKSTEAVRKFGANFVDAALSAKNELGETVGVKVLSNIVTSEEARTDGFGTEGWRVNARKVAGLGSAAFKQARGLAAVGAKGVTDIAKNDHYKSAIAESTKNAATSAGQTLGGIGAGLAYAAVVKGSAELVRDAVLDAGAAVDRHEFQALVKNYRASDDTFLDPSTGKYAEDPAKLAQLRELLGKKGADRARSNAQALVDRGSQAKNLTINSATAVASTFTAVGKAAAEVTLGKVAGNLIPGLNIAVTGLSAANSIWNTGVNIVALANAEQAKANAKGDVVLESISKHILQERTYNTRKHLLATATNTLAFSLNVAALAAGPAAPGAIAVAALVSTGLSTGAAVAIAAWDIGHGSLLNSRRGKVSEDDLTQALLAYQSQSGGNEAIKSELKEFLSSAKNIGLAERALLSQLRSGAPEDAERASQFLHDLGLKKGTIARLKLEKNPEAALKTLRQAIYTDKVQYHVASAKSVLSAFGRIVGVTQFREWRAHKAEVKRDGPSGFYRSGLPSWSLGPIRQPASSAPPGSEAAKKEQEAARRLAFEALRPKPQPATEHSTSSHRTRHVQDLERARPAFAGIEMEELHVQNRQPRRIWDDVDF